MLFRAIVGMVGRSVSSPTTRCSKDLGCCVRTVEHGPFTFPILFVTVLFPTIHRWKCGFAGARRPVPRGLFQVLLGFEVTREKDGYH